MREASSVGESHFATPLRGRAGQPRACLSRGHAASARGHLAHALDDFVTLLGAAIRRCL